MTNSIMMPIMTRPNPTVIYDLLFDKEYHSKHFYIDHFISKKLSFTTIDNGYIVPYSSPLTRNGVFDSEGHYVADTGFGKNAAGDESEQRLQEMTIEHNHSTVIYLGVMLKIWGHFLTDDMSRLWFLRSKEYRDSFQDCTVTYLPVLGFEIKNNWRRMLEILDVNLAMMTPMTRPVKYDRIIIPDKCFFPLPNGKRYFTKEYAEIINHVRDFAIARSRPTPTKKVYFSYSKYTKTKSFGEDKLEKYFVSKGYEIVYPEKLSLEEQLNILVNCESFASTDGSCAHNSLFLRDNTEVILIPRANYLTGYQLAINQVHQQNVHYIDSSLSIFIGEEPWVGPFLYFISSNLRKYFHDEDTECIVSLSDFWRYMLAAFGLKFSRSFGILANGDNSNAYRYYSVVAADYFGKLFAQAKQQWPYRLRQFVKRLLGRK